jgi:hypothetical protein
MRDRFGLSWRGELAAGILAQAGRIDCLEVIADDYFDAGDRAVRSLRTLGRHLPLSLHGIQLGMASTVPVETRRLEKMARLVDRVQPESWSEHLAFVRGGGIEIGHLAAPPRNPVTVEATLLNLDRARRAVGCAPVVENVATLIDPPGSPLSEAEWLARLLAASDCELLLDLHNVYTNALNFGWDAAAFLRALPLARVGAIHLAGGKWIAGPGGARRYLDDHLHAVPDPVYSLLELVAARTDRPLTVILERDGHFPPMSVLLEELDRARQAVAAGRRAHQYACV